MAVEAASRRLLSLYEQASIALSCCAEFVVDTSSPQAAMSACRSGSKVQKADFELHRIDN